MASALFSTVTLRGLTLPNRNAFSPLWSYDSNGGSGIDWVESGWMEVFANRRKAD